MVGGHASHHRAAAHGHDGRRGVATGEFRGMVYWRLFPPAARPSQSGGVLHGGAEQATARTVML